MANLNYFDPTSDEAPVAQDTSSADASKGGVRKAWDAFTSKPENNAALIQFGIAMMQPRTQGQSSFGQLGNAVGSAGEASTANLAAQSAEQDRIAQRDERQSTADYRKAQSTAALQNAASYGRQVDNTPGGGSGLARTALSAQLRTQQAFRQWLQKPEDITGLSQDPLLGAVQKEFPAIKTKADLARNPLAQKRAFQIYNQSMSEEPPNDGGEDPATAAPPGAAQPPAPGVAAPPAQPTVKTFYNKSTGAPEQFQWNGTGWTKLQ